MGWAVGYDERWQRDIGYGVPATCDQPGCNETIDRGLSYVCCEQQPRGGENGCGLYFCGKHLGMYRCAVVEEDEIEEDDDQGDYGPMCERCAKHQDPFPPKPEHPEWVEHKLHDPSWDPWRKDHPRETSAMRRVMAMREAGYNAEYYPLQNDPMKLLEFNNLTTANIERQKEWLIGGESKVGLEFRAIELAGEVGEALNVIKKLVREQRGWRGTRATLLDLEAELADVIICTDLLAIEAGIDLKAAVANKFNATSEKHGFPHRLKVTLL